MENKEKSLTKVPADRQIITNTQISVLMGEVPSKYIKERPARGGGTWKYVTSAFVKRQLDIAFGLDWDFEIKQFGTDNGSVWVLGKITVRGKDNRQITREQFGSKEITYRKGTKEFLDYGNDLKAATSDCLKKCASELGIAGQVYAEEEQKYIAGEMIKEAKSKKDEIIEANQVIVKTEGNTTITKATIQKDLGGIPKPVKVEEVPTVGEGILKQPVSEQKVNTKIMALYFAKMKGYGYESEKAKELIKTRYKVESFKDLTIKQVNDYLVDKANENR